jgi:hypothetical protein
MPCPNESSGFWLGAELYKEGCMGKLAKLVISEDESITWTITYWQTLNGEDQALAQSMIRFFPRERVEFSAMGSYGTGHFHTGASIQSPQEKKES